MAAGAGVSALILHQYVSDRQMIEKEPGRRGDEKRRCLCLCVCVGGGAGGGGLSVMVFRDMTRAQT